MRRLALASLLVLGCKDAPPPEPGLAPEPLPADGSLPPGAEAMLFGGQRGCRDDLDCESHACEFGACAGLVTVDTPWRAERIGERVRERLGLQPELRPLLTAFLAHVARREEMGLAFRGRAVNALAELYGPDDDLAPATLALKELLASSPAPIAEIAALALARLGDASGLDTVIALTQSEHISTACEALRTLGRAKPPPSSGALAALLSALSPDLDLELQRAAIDGLGALGDRRAIRPLASYLTNGPEALADDVASVLRQLTGAAFGPDPLRWDAWVGEHAPPPPPEYTPRGRDSADDIDLPTP